MLEVDDGEDRTFSRARKRAAPDGDDDQRRRHWFPWHDKITCTLDVLMHLPRSVFSQRQLDLFLWLLKVNGMEDVPSVRSMLGLNAALQRACGIDSVPYKGALGHTYYVNSLPQILAQEMANPRVRPHLHFYPEDTRGQVLGEARQASKWLKEMPNELLTPMLRLGDRDFYIHEPAMRNDGQVCMPVRWFNRLEGASGGDRVWYAKCWRMEVVRTEAREGWRVIMDEGEIRADELLKTFPELQADTVSRRYDLPSPSDILEVVDPETGLTSSWSLTEPAQGNIWRGRAKGYRVLSMPLWLYCDDTSGNLSKKWNEHNSVLFTLAGLPREQVQKEFNVHFLTTSNLAPPLEMIDGVVSQLESAQREGVWAWDAQLCEPVLVVPWVLAMLGDNPMQSEFASHIGMNAKRFCRNCWVKGKDMADESAAGSSDATSADGDGAGKGKAAKRGKRLESMEDMLTRVRAFLKIGKKRTKEETGSQLRSYFEMASVPGTKTKIAKERTQTGIKDTFQLAFLNKLFDSYKGKRGMEAKQNALDAAIAALPTNTTNPIWRIKGLDAHQDTPVEVLHVVLLGFVKYLWRDLVQTKLKNKDTQKKLLATRLSSVDVTGLGISPLVGHTLVQYAGSLTGRDFRAIAQVAPFVIYDMVSPECFETWLALSKLVPLIWQPVIHGVDEYLNTLSKEIRHFLLCAARWNVRWFNKSKYHVVLHLVEHIRRFGPAALFATEAFESFNAVIRAKSVHSNRQAPSRDIAHGFAQGNRIRHLLSGGYFQHSPQERDVREGDSSMSRTPFSFLAGDWRTVGEGPRSLAQTESTVTAYLGGQCVYAKSALHSWTETKSAKIFPGLSEEYSRFEFKTSTEVTLLNGDTCKPGGYVIASSPPGVQVPNTSESSHNTYVACVDEILTVRGTPEDLHRQSNMILLHRASVTRANPKYRMPHIDMQNAYHLCRIEDLKCTVNVQHNCDARGCTDSGSRRTREERLLTNKTTTMVEHNVPLDDLLLNTAQMRDALYVQPFRIASPDLNSDEITMVAVQREILGRKAASAQLRQQIAVSGRARGTGSRGGRGSHGQRRGSRLRGASSLGVDDGETGDERTRSLLETAPQ
ncbi:hypothetical protein C8Q76DRAFT_614464 [Earliella scabrosa]|nr:hypothetical protein C8Q76DRAFT_614464 [Earliella scabrosa]